jgi:hypothetical protein
MTKMDHEKRARHDLVKQNVLEDRQRDAHKESIARVDAIEQRGKVITLRWIARCATCGERIRAGTDALWHVGGRIEHLAVSCPARPEHARASSVVRLPRAEPDDMWRSAV